MSVEVRSQQLLFVLFFFSPFKFSVEAKRMTSVEFFFHQMSLTDLNSGYWHWVMICSLSSKYFITLHGLRISAKVLHLESWQILSPLMFVEAPQLSSCCFSLSVRIHSTQETPGFFVLLFSFHSGFETTKLLRVTVGQWGSRRGRVPLVHHGQICSSDTRFTQQFSSVWFVLTGVTPVSEHLDLQLHILTSRVCIYVYWLPPTWLSILIFTYSFRNWQTLSSVWI